MSMKFTIILVQMMCQEGDRDFNFDRANDLLKECRPSDDLRFIILPELFAIGFRKEDYDKVGPGFPGPTSEFLCELAKKNRAYVFATDIEQSDKNVRRYYNTLIAASPSGEIFGSYRKIHPFQEERDIFDGGERIVILDCNGIKVGVQICYDLRFPEVSRKLALEGAELLVIPAAFPDPRSAHWNTLVQARAIENQVYVAATNRVGFGFDKKSYFGHSQIVDPWGIVLTRPNSEPRAIMANGNTAMIKSVREQITCYADRSLKGYEKVALFHG
ncbi:hypothetical protein EU527_11690 [Candidatus Thorarchaeota archaeon]|nr:MAG: hypothetical protein EU527_11690 [Candidatus Thorarchaeota archaeon]